jgi:hypothetical protein
MTMIDKWLSTIRIAEITGLNKRTIQINAKEQEWPKRMVDGNGGKQPRYHIKDLPEYIQIAYAASLNIDLWGFDRLRSCSYTQQLGM